MIIKKILMCVLCISILAVNVCFVTSADNNQLEIGDYIQLGTYEGNPIIWRYVVNDDNGKLIVSDKVLCTKRYSSPKYTAEDYQVVWITNSVLWAETNYWTVSTIRAWLNSNEGAGNVTWLDNNPPLDFREFRIYPYNGYANEAGFLSEQNFSPSQIKLFKSVSQWTMLPGSHVDLSENGLNEQYNRLKRVIKLSSTGRDTMYDYEFYGLSDIPNIYYGAALQTTDKMFLLDDLQLYNVWTNFGTVCTTSVSGTESECFILRSGFTAWGGEEYVAGSAMDPKGIRPAFYLNETAVSGMTGSGTAEDPYILIPDPDYVSVEVNGEAVAFDVAPVMESDRVLVPMRAIFEDLGATVEWEGETETVTATKDDTVITLQINNNVMTKNGEEIILDVPARLVGDRTLVPIRAVAEGLDATVDWIDEENKVVITK